MEPEFLKEKEWVNLNTVSRTVAIPYLILRSAALKVLRPTEVWSLRGGDVLVLRPTLDRIFDESTRLLAEQKVKRMRDGAQRTLQQKKFDKRWKDYYARAVEFCTAEKDGEPAYPNLGPEPFEGSEDWRSVPLTAAELKAIDQKISEKTRGWTK